MTVVDDRFAAWQALGVPAEAEVETTGPRPLRVLVAGVGNQLRADDAFGVVVAHRLMEMDCPHMMVVRQPMRQSAHDVLTFTRPGHTAS